MPLIPLSCPICKIPTPKLDNICITCKDSILDNLRAKRPIALKTASKRADAHKRAYSRVVRGKAQRERREAERAREKALKEQSKLLTELQVEQASRALAKRSLLHYVERYKPGYDASWSHEDVARRIERFVNDVAEGKNPRLILQIPSRFGKSLLASDAGPGWILGNHPDWNIVIASYSDELPVAFSKNVRMQLRSPEFRAIFPRGARLNPEDSGAKAWTTLEGGGLRATGVGGGLLGFGANILIVDDPIKDMEQADSPGALEKVYDWFSSVAYSRLLPGGGILVIQQRMAYEDLVGRLIARMEEEEEQVKELLVDAEKLRMSVSKPPPAIEEEAQQLEAEAKELSDSMDRWDVATYPALATHDEYLSDTGEIIRLQSTQSPEPSWKLLRKKGEAIHPKRYTRNYYLKLKRANPTRFAAMYQLTPQNEDGEYFGSGSFIRYPFAKRPKTDQCYSFATWDLAIGTKQSNDHTVGIAGLYDSEGNIWLVDRIRGKWGDVRVVADMVIDLHVKWNCSQTGIERTHIEMAMGPILKTRMRERGTYISLAEGKEALKPISDKKVRARPLQNLCNGKKVYVPEGEDWDEYISLMTRFGSSSVDDDVDATAWLAILALRHTPPLSAEQERKLNQPQKTSWYDDFIAEHTGWESEFMGS